MPRPTNHITRRELLAGAGAGAAALLIDPNGVQAQPAAGLVSRETRRRGGALAVFAVEHWSFSPCATVIGVTARPTRARPALCSPGVLAAISMV